MARRAALGLRAAGWVRLLAVAATIVFFAIERWLWSLAWSYGEGVDPRLVLQRYRAVSFVDHWITIGLAGATLVGFALLVSDREGRARTLAVAALTTGALFVALMIFDVLVPPPPRRYEDGLRPALALARMILGYASSFLALCAAAPKVRARNPGWSAALGFLALVTLVAASGIVLQVIGPLEKLADGVSIVRFAVATASEVTFAIAAFWLAGDRPRMEDRAASAPVSAPGGDARPLRLLGWTIGVRSIVVVPLGAVATLAALGSARDLAQITIHAGMLLSVVVAALLVISLLAQRQLPDALCNRHALTLAAVLACVGAFVDVWSAFIASDLQLLRGGQMRSFLWSEPARLQTLQATAIWTWRVSFAIGFATSVAIVRALRATARGLGDERLVARAARVQALLVYAGGAVLTISILGPAVLGSLRSNGAFMFALLLAAGLLILAVVLVVELLRLTFGVARALGTGAPPAPLSSPAPV